MANPQTPSQQNDKTLHRAITYEVPPAGFDIHTATDRMLGLYGIPRKPDAGKEPHLRKLWENAFATNPAFIKAEPTINASRPKRKRKTIDRQPGADDFGPLGWAGLTVPLNGSQKANMIYGEWTVPGFALLDKEYYPVEKIGIWIGIDDGPDVLQAGTESTVTGESVQHFLFTEWYDNDPSFISNFDIDTGDYIIVMICYDGGAFATCTTLNKTKNVATTLRIYPPTDVVLLGNTVEWVMEVEGDINVELPKFNPVTINNCIASSASGYINLTNGGVTNIKGYGNANLTAVSVTTSVVIDWIKEV